MGGGGGEEVSADVIYFWKRFATLLKTDTKYLIVHSRPQSLRSFWPVVGIESSGPISFPEPTCILVSTKTRELWNNQFPETKISGLPASRHMRGLAYMASRDKVHVNTFHKGIQYALEKLGKLKFGFERTAVSNLKSKTDEGSGNELVDYSRAPCLGADQKVRGLWERDWLWPDPIF